MESNGTPNISNTRVQPSIRSFFQPRQPSYTAPPGAIAPKSNIALPLSSDSQLPPTATPAASKPTRSTLPQQASISFIQEPHIQPLHRINSLLLPINYPDSFYRKILHPDSPISFSRVITWTDSSSSETKVIGGIVCRLDPALAPDSTPQVPKFQDGIYDVYIQSLALLSPYRGKGLVAEVLNEVIESATAQQELRIASLYAHVWTENEEAVKWYSARGFRREDPAIQGYYRRLKPDTAWIFRRRLNPRDHLQHAAPQAFPIQSSTLTPAPTPPMPKPSTPDIPPPPSPNPATTRPSGPSHARSFQDRGPDREWNDLPDDVLGGNPLLKPPSHLNSKEGSAASSRSSSRSGTEKGKKKRVYPAAAFGP